jgi:hypothetical protein
MITNLLNRCVDGCAHVINCEDLYVQSPVLRVQATYTLSSLANYPPIGSKGGALCYQDSVEAGNAQCTADCVSVTALNGSTFYPAVGSILRRCDIL